MKRSVKMSIHSNSKQSEAASKKLTISQLRENLKYATWDKPKQTEGEHRYQQWYKLKNMSKQLKYFYKHSYGKEKYDDVGKKFNCIAGNSDGDVSSEVSLDEIRYEDEESGNHTDTIHSEASAEEHSSISKKHSLNQNVENQVLEVPNR